MLLPPELLALFDDAEGVETLRADELIFAAGDAADSMVLLLEGSVEILVKGAVVSRLERGSIFGEMALIDGEPRSGTARASTASRIVRVSAKQFRFLVKHVPAFAEFMLRLVSSRLRELVAKGPA